MLLSLYKFKKGTVEESWIYETKEHAWRGQEKETKRTSYSCYTQLQVLHKKDRIERKKTRSSFQ